MEAQDIAHEEPHGDFQCAQDPHIHMRQAQVMGHVAAQVEIPGHRAFLVGEAVLKGYHTGQGDLIELVRQ